MPDIHAARLSPRAALRAATAEVHERLHGARFFGALADGTLDRAGYGALLTRIRRFHRRTLGPRSQALAALGLDPADAPRRLGLIDADLRHLGLDFNDEPAPPPLACSDGEAVGYLYVVEGSTLGGKLIYRQLDYLLPDDRGRSFFRGAPDDGARWRRLCDALDTYGALPAMIAGAKAAFALFETCLNEEPE